MKVAILGAGAIGAYVGAALHRGGADVHLIARGAHLRALRTDGVRVLSPRGDFLARPPATDDPAEIGPVDYVFLGLKAHSYPSAGPLVEPLLGPDTAVIAGQNGIPWWYFHGYDGPEAETPFETVDPGGAVWRAIRPERALGCALYLPASLSSPGVAHHDGILQLILGAPKPGTHEAALARIGLLLEAAGIETRVVPDIRRAVWTKLLLNTGSATLSILTGATVGQLRAGPGMAEIRTRLMREAQATAEAWGVPLGDAAEKVMAATGGAEAHKVSMLQDYEAGRPLELDAIVKAVIDLARRRQVPVPTIETLWSAAMLKLVVEGHPGVSS